jgi:hypothetical protein
LPAAASRAPKYPPTAPVAIVAMRMISSQVRQQRRSVVRRLPDA